MDLFTHLLVSVAVAYSVNTDEDKQRAFVIGGIAPDFDVFISWLPILLPELYFLQHRGLIHTIFFAPIMAAALIGLTRSFERISNKKIIRALSQKAATPLNPRTVVFGALGSIGHLLIDFLTTRGVVLFYPLNSTRFSLGVISSFDAVITLLSTAMVLFLLYRQYKAPDTMSFGRFVRFSQVFAIVFLFVVVLYGSLQFYTLTTQSETSTTATGLPIYRWTFTEENDQVNIHFVNQLTQKVEKTYSYPFLTFNRTLWNEDQIESVIKEAKKTKDFKAMEFELEPETLLVYEVEFMEEEGNWEVDITNILRDAQRRLYGLPETSFFENGKIIIVKLDS